MAIAPQNLMSKLRFMEDAELASFADVHHNDPFIFPLAFQESQDRKKLRMAKQAQAGQAQPKVVDQALQQMQPETQMQAQPQAQTLPEDQGIAQLSAPNMENINMASGGIVAFEEGGEVPRYQNQGLVQQPLPGGLGIYSQGSFGPQAGDAELQARIARIESNVRMSRADKDMLIADARQKFGLPKTTTIPPTTPVPMGDKPAATTPAPTTTAQTSPLINKDKGVVDKAVERKQVEDDAAAAGKKLPPEPGLPSINSYMKQFEANLPKKEDAQTEETFMNKRAEPMKEFFTKAGANIEKEAARLKSDKEQDFYMSLIQGGLAAAAESGPNALQNIAKGFSVGAGSYKDALKDFRKASQENSRMEMDLMKAKAADKKGDMDAYQKHTESVAERNGKIDQLKASGVASLLGHQMSASATLGAAKLSRDAMGDYRNAGQVETIRKNIDAKLGDDPKYKFNAAARAAEVERRLQLELQRYPNLVGYAGTPTTGGASGATNQGWGQAQIVK
jgi:hypothetical protein